MKKFLRSELEAMSLGELLVLLNPDFNIGTTHFPTPVSEDGEYLKNPKRWMIQHDLRIVAESIDFQDEIDEPETLGHDIEAVRFAAKYPPIFGNTPKECLINFLTINAELTL